MIAPLVSQRRPVSLRISVTDRCQQRCLYCMPPAGVPKVERSAILSFAEIIRFVRIVKLRFAISKLHLTGGEPLLRPGITELIRMLSREGIADIVLTTNGQSLAEMAGQLKAAGLDRVNISLDSLDGVTYRTLTRGGNLAKTVAGISAAAAAGFSPVKINTVVMREHNYGELEDLTHFAWEHHCAIRFLELMPIGCAKPIFGRQFVSSHETHLRLAEAFSLRPLPGTPGQSSRNYFGSAGNGLTGVVGFISAQTMPFCAGCTRLRLTSTGSLISCLAQGTGPNVRESLVPDSPVAAKALLDQIETMLAGKCSHSGFDTARPMAAVGG